MGTASWRRLSERTGQAGKALVRQASAGSGKNPPSDHGGKQVRAALSKREDTKTCERHAGKMYVQETQERGSLFSSSGYCREL